jgi:hypothetical protein
MKYFDYAKAIRLVDGNRDKIVKAEAAYSKECLEHEPDKYSRAKVTLWFKGFGWYPNAIFGSEDYDIVVLLHMDGQEEPIECSCSIDTGTHWQR